MHIERNRILVKLEMHSVFIFRALVRQEFFHFLMNFEIIYQITDPQYGLWNASGASSPFL